MKGMGGGRLKSTNFMQLPNPSGRPKHGDFPVPTSIDLDRPQPTSDETLPKTSEIKDLSFLTYIYIYIYIRKERDAAILMV